MGEIERIHRIDPAGFSRVTPDGQKKPPEREPKKQPQDSVELHSEEVAEAASLPENHGEDGHIDIAA